MQVLMGARDNAALFRVLSSLLASPVLPIDATKIRHVLVLAVVLRQAKRLARACNISGWLVGRKGVSTALLMRVVGLFTGQLRERTPGKPTTKKATGDEVQCPQKGQFGSAHAQ
jgi:hypothetical protein